MDRMHDKSIAGTIIALPLLLWSAVGWGGSVDAFAIRNQHPFLHIFGLPLLQDATLVPRGKTDFGLLFTLVNNAEVKDTDTESIRLDGESYFMDLVVRHRVHERLEVGVAVPFVRHSAGVFDDAIFDWHDFWGMSNSKRDGEGNLLNYRYSNNGSVEQLIDTSSSGIGDVRLSVATPLLRGDGEHDRRVTMRLSIKLPTGDSADVHGSGATDVALGVYAQDTGQLFGRDLGYLGFAGVLALGDGDILPEQQRSAVPYGGAAATWHATDSFGITGQVQAQGAYFDSDLDELGGSSIQLAVGGIYRFKRSGVTLRFALIEDLISDATPDFALHFGVHVGGGQ